MAGPLEQHYRLVCKPIMEGRIVFFLGAGASLCERKGDFQRQQNFPTGGELSEFLAKQFFYPGKDPKDLARVSQFIETELESGPLRDALNDIFVFEPPYPPTVLHRFLSGLPGRLGDALPKAPARVRHQLLLTTNYDSLLEDAFREAGEPFDVVWYDAQAEHASRLLHWNGVPGAESVPIADPATYRAVSLEERSVIFKMHGTLHLGDPERGSFVITEDHYIDYLTRASVDNLVPVLLREPLKKSHFLFLGSSLRDWNVRAMLRGIQHGQRFKYRGWAVDRSDDPLERKFWDRRNVDFITSELESYVKGLSAQLEIVLGEGA